MASQNATPTARGGTVRDGAAPTTDQKVGGSNPSERTSEAQVRGLHRWPNNALGRAVDHMAESHVVDEGQGGHLGAERVPGPGRRGPVRHRHVTFNGGTWPGWCRSGCFAGTWLTHGTDPVSSPPKPVLISAIGASC